MEASIAGNGQQGDGQGQGAAEAQDTGQQQGGQDIAQLAEQFATLAGGQEELRQLLQAQAQQETGVEEPEADPFADLDLSFLDPSEPGYDPEQVAQQMSGLIDRVAEERAKQIAQPLAQRLDSIESQTAEERIRRESQELVSEFPELGQDDVAQQVVGAARQIAEAQGTPELANEPWFWRLTYMAGRAAELANEEGSDDPAAAHLEGGGGARPAGSQQVDPGEAIVTARRGSGVLPF